MGAHQPGKHHTRASDPGQALLPHVRVVVADTGVLDVTVDGAVYPAPDGGAWRRETFADLLDTVTEKRSMAVRVEVREVDGTVFTDLIQPATPTRTLEPAPTPKPQRKNRPMLVEISADGFLPGEDVAVAVILTHTDATGGQARALLDLTQLPDPHGETWEVVLFGRISGTLHVEALS